MPIQVGSKGLTVAGVEYPPHTYLDWLSVDQESSAVQGGDAFYVPRRTLDPAEVIAVRALVAGGGIDVSFQRASDGIPNAHYTLDAGVGQVLPVMRVVVEAATDVIAAQRISNGGTNTFQTVITGASAVGDVIPIALLGAARVTSVVIGSSAGVNQTIDSDNNVTVNEIAKWTCLLGDDCNFLFVRFAPPRSSGRYCDVSVVGKRAA